MQAEVVEAGRGHDICLQINSILGTSGTRKHVHSQFSHHSIISNYLQNLQAPELLQASARQLDILIQQAQQQQQQQLLGHHTPQPTNWINPWQQQTP